MELIDKDAVITEMKRRIFNLEQLGDRKFIETHFPEQFRFIEVYEGIVDFINTLKVKEVDLEKEIDLFVQGWNIDEFLGLVNDEGWSVTVGDVKNVARHFFELGLKAQKGE